MERLLILLVGLLPNLCLSASKFSNLEATHTTAGLFALCLFLVAYALVMTEEFTHLRKSKPVVIAAGLIWVVVASICNQRGLSHVADTAVRHNILEYAELFMFLLVAMTYVNVMEERNVFAALRCWLIARRFSYRTLFWVTGLLSFFISPIADNLTTALLMCAVVMAVAKNDDSFVSLACVNIVVAANAGGAFSPFGDITTLMVWQAGILKFFDFFHIFIPSLVSYVIPAALMSLAIKTGRPLSDEKNVPVKKGGYFCIFLFAVTIVTAVMFHNILELPPMVGMMTGLGYLNFFSYYLKQFELREFGKMKTQSTPVPFDVFNRIKHAEWDTLFFFYGVILCVGGLATIGYLESLSTFIYQDLGKSLLDIHQATPGNVILGILSSIIDNIPVMFAVLTMEPVMSKGQWLLITLTTGIGGSLLSIGSAAGVALMGQAKGKYTFFGHIRWVFAILLGYIAAVVVHIWLNVNLFYQSAQ